MAQSGIDRFWLLIGSDAVTSARRITSVAAGRCSAATVGDTVKFGNIVPRMSASAAIALAVAFLLLATGALWDQIRDGITPAHAPHAHATVWAPEFGVTAEHEHPIIAHPHAQEASKHVTPDSFATAAMRRAGTALVALGLLIVALGLAWLWLQRLPVAARGPPRPSPLVLSNRDMLARLCIARC